MAEQVAGPPQEAFYGRLSYCIDDDVVPRRTNEFTTRNMRTSRYNQIAVGTISANVTEHLTQRDAILGSVGKHTLPQRFRHSTAATGGGRYKKRVFRRSLVLRHT